MKTTILSAAAAVAFLPAQAMPSADNYASVTNDWQQGNYSNVYEWAQSRLSANTNDLPAAYVMVEYDVSFSDFTSMSNSIMRMMRVSDTATLPAFTNLYHKTRPGWTYYLENFLPAQNESEREAEQLKSLAPGRPLTCSPFLDILWENSLWEPVQ